MRNTRIHSILFATTVIFALHGCSVVQCASTRNLQVRTVTKLELINANTDRKIMDLFDGQIIYMRDIPNLTSPNFNINATVSSGTVSSVRFGYKTNTNFRTDNSFPYSFCGNQRQDFNTCKQLTYGVHPVTATAINNGVVGPTVSLTFTIVDGSKMSPIQSPMNRPVSPPVRAPIPISSPVATPAIHTLRLMYTGVNPSVPIMNLTFDRVNVINLQELKLPSGKFNIDTLVTPNVKSVSYSNGRIETSAPLSYCGNSGNNFFDCEDLVDDANITVTIIAYPESGGAGTPIQTRSTIIHIIRPRAPIAPPPPTRAPVPAPIIPPVSGCPLPKLVGNWERAVPYPIQVAEAQGAMIGNDFVITSGFNGGYSTATPETYALDMFTPNAQWRRMDDMPFPLGLTHLGVAVKGTKGYFCGGYIGGSLGIHNGSCFQYDHAIAPGSGRQWTNFSSIPDGGRSGGGLIYDSTLDALVYSAGSHRPRQGIKGAIDYRDTWMYSLKDPSAGWVPKADIPFTGNHMNFVTAFDEVGKERHFFFGGQAGDNEETGNTNLMYEYSAVSDVWSKKQSIPYPLGHAAATARAIGCGFIVAGGRINTGLTSAISYYDIPTNTWTKIGDLTHQIHTNVCVIAEGWLRCETGWATGTFSWRHSITL